MTVKLQNEQHLGFLSLKGGCTGSSESILVKMPHCWKAHVAAHINLVKVICLLVTTADNPYKQFGHRSGLKLLEDFNQNKIHFVLDDNFAG